MRFRTISVAIAGALAAPPAAQGVKYKLSGQVNRAVVYMDDGADTALRNVDAITSGTRIRLKGSEDLGNGMQVGFYWEFQAASNPSFTNRPGPETTVAGVGNGDNTSDLDDGSNLRHANVFFSGAWGRLTIGKGSGAGDGATEVDLSGTTSALYHGRTSFTGGMLWRTSSGGTIADGLLAIETYRELDAFGRYDQVRYDSPALGPVVLSASVGNDNRWEVAGRLNTRLAGGTLSAALFYGESHGLSPLDNDRYGGSASYLFSQGTNLTLAYGHQRQNAAGGTSSDAYTIKLGHRWGPHAVAVQYSVGEDLTPGYTDTSVGLAYNHDLPRANTNLYAAWQYDQLDTPGGIAGVEDHAIVVMGARVKFD